MISELKTFLATNQLYKTINYVEEVQFKIKK